MEITDSRQTTKRNLVLLQSLKCNQALLWITNRIQAFFIKLYAYQQNFSLSSISFPSF
jgi:hypothetical protein